MFFYIIEKEKSPWGDENIGHTCYMRLTHNRKREIPVRGRKQSQHSIKSHLFYRKREIPVRGRKLHYVSWLDFEICIEKEKSPWGDENCTVGIYDHSIVNHRKREIPGRGRKRNCWNSFSPFDFNRKREIPVRGRKPLYQILFVVNTFIEKEKSPWGDENKNLNKSIICSFIL